MNHRKLKVLVLINSEGAPPFDNDFGKWLDDVTNDDWSAERDVVNSLKRLGHQVRILGIYDDITLLMSIVRTEKPDVVFNLTENFCGDDLLDKNIAGVLELLGVPFTGSGVTALALCRNKGLSKQLLNFHRIKVPRFAAFNRGRRIWHPKRLKFPLVVKPLRQDASLGISQSSFTDNPKDFCERVRYVHENLKMDAIAEEYIDGRELYVSVIGERRLTVLPVREMKFGLIQEDEPRVATYKAKWDNEYRNRWKIANVFAGRLPNGVNRTIDEICKKAFRILMLNSYARFDLRLSNDREPYIIEANPNPFLAADDELAQSAMKAGMTYDDLIQKLLIFALQVAGQRRQ
jgi:D-alanine-D-alanine ligase